MILKEEKRNLFNVDEKYYLAHCISSDYALGAGIAVNFQNKYHLKQALKNIGNGEFPDCILIARVFNLVTKNKYWNKPTYNSLQKSLEIMKEMIVNKPTGVEIKYLAIPRIASGLDRLQWAKVREIIKEVFDDMDIEILVCRL